ncbi:MAG: hypothetical protein K8S94_09915 [Planctomycetia bacterium]|nr:hypothetical protein [Planctomycetia bacterium]
MVRLPQPRAFLEAIRTRTKFGAVALGDQRLQGLWTVLLDTLPKNVAGDDVDSLEQRLGKYGLTPDDLQAGFRGDMGAGFVVRSRDGGLPPLVMMLAWLEPGEETAARLVEAAKKRVEERHTANEPDAPKRIDLELAGHDVLWMIEPVLSIDAADLGLDDLDGDDPKKRLEAIREKARNAPFVKVGQTHAFLARMGDRLLVGHTVPMALGAEKDGGEVDVDATSGTEEARGIFERFLTAHAEDGDSSLADVLRMPGMAGLPGGDVLADVIVDPRVFFRASGDDSIQERLATIGAANMGPLAWRQSLDGNRYHSGMLLSLPAPRTNLMRILDQECDPAEVPSFVTREAIDLTQISLDLGKAYETVREFAVGQGGPETANMFTAVEMQAQGWLGVDLPKLLTSLGSRHWLVSYPPEFGEALAAARQARADDRAAARQFVDRAALVWQIEDEAPFGKILQRLAGMAGGDGEMQEEQGFRGVRIPDGPAIYMGQGHLVVAIGKDSLEKTLAAIRNPPVGESSLRESEVVRRAGDMLPLQPARMFSVSDSTRSGGTLGMLREMAAAMVPEDVAEPYREMLAGIQKLLPSADETEAMFGVGATMLRADDAGVSLQSVWEMPAP